MTKKSHSLKNDLFWLMIGTIFLNVLRVSVRLASQFQLYNNLADIAGKGSQMVILSLFLSLILRCKFKRLYDIDIKKIIICLLCLKIVLLVLGLFLPPLGM